MSVGDPAPLDRLIERSRRMGGRPDLIVHGGGNTSTKTIATDHLGRSRPVLIVKASGADLRAIDAAGFVELYLDELLFAREQEDMDDDRMMSFVDRCLVRPTRRRASIETLLHAFLPARDVDHVHADAICALTKAPDPERAIREALGGDVAYVEYVRPGFGLAKRVAALAGYEAVVLGHHGLVTWSDDGRSLDCVTLLVERAERYITNARRAVSFSAASASLPAEATEALLLRLRSRLSRESRVVLHVDRSARRISDRADVDRIAEAGPATADHLLLVRPWSLVVRSDADVAPAIDAYEGRYRSYWERHAARAPGGYGMRSSLPTVIVVPGLGVIGAGRSKGQARKVAEVAAHTHAVAASATDVFDAAVTLSDEDLFDIDYWPLELAKIAPAGAQEMAGRVIIVTGAASGIGHAVALALAGAGAHVVGADIDEDGLRELDREIQPMGAEALMVRCDVRDEADVDRMVSSAVAEFGGVDGAVSNAGIAVTGRLADLPRRSWDESLAANATSHFLVARRLLKVFEAQRLEGSLVFVASKNAFDPGIGFGPYSVAKAAEIQLARMVAVEGGPLGVRSNVINPDAVFGGSRLWSMDLRRSRAEARGIDVADLERAYVERNLLHRPVRAHDVAEAALFLLSDRSSRTTGCVITVDGGLSAAFPR